MTPPEAAVLAANQSFYAAFRKRDASAMDRLWAKAQPVACVHPGRNAMAGREAVLASFRAILGSAHSPAIRATEEAVLFFGETAVVTCIEQVGGAELVATNVFFFEEGAWKMVHHHASPVAREMTSAPVKKASELN